MHKNSKNPLSDSSYGKRRRDRKNGDRAVSPVVGVMLMLVVVIIIAAVVSGFSGNLVNGHTTKAPSLAMDLEIANSGHWSNSYFKGEVTSVSAPISTHNLKIVTSWIKHFPNGTIIHGGATTTPGIVNFNVIYDTHGGAGYDLWRMTVPLGYGQGVGSNVSQFTNTSSGGNIFWNVDGGGGEYALQAGSVSNTSWWGNYNLQAGTVFLARPFGGKVSYQAYVANGLSSSQPMQFLSGYGVTQRFRYNYSNPSEYPYDGKLTMEGYSSVTTSDSNGWLFPYPTTSDQEPNVWIPYVSSLPSGWDPRTSSIDMMQGVLGNQWEVLRPGDTVNVKIIHIPTGSTIWQKDVSVTGTTN